MWWIRGVLNKNLIELRTMSGYIRSIDYNPNYPDVRLVGHSIVYMTNIPEHITNNLEVLEIEVDNLANQAGAVFHTSLTAKAYAHKGNILLDIFFSFRFARIIVYRKFKILKGLYKRRNNFRNQGRNGCLYGAQNF